MKCCPRTHSQPRCTGCRLPVACPGCERAQRALPAPCSCWCYGQAGFPAGSVVPGQAAASSLCGAQPQVAQCCLGTWPQRDACQACLWLCSWRGTAGTSLEQPRVVLLVCAKFQLPINARGPRGAVPLPRLTSAHGYPQDGSAVLCCSIPTQLLWSRAFWEPRVPGHDQAVE